MWCRNTVVILSTSIVCAAAIYHKEFFIVHYNMYHTRGGCCRIYALRIITEIFSDGGKGCGSIIFFYQNHVEFINTVKTVRKLEFTVDSN